MNRYSPLCDGELYSADMPVCHYATPRVRKVGETTFVNMDSALDSGVGTHGYDVKDGNSL
jgi:hypothetical protein